MGQIHILKFINLFSTVPIGRNCKKNSLRDYWLPVSFASRFSKSTTQCCVWQGQDLFFYIPPGEADTYREAPTLSH